MFILVNKDYYFYCYSCLFVGLCILSEQLQSANVSISENMILGNLRNVSMAGTVLLLESSALMICSMKNASMTLKYYNTRN